MFITFEGIDGCGKSTQLELLNDYLISKNKKTLLLREPGGTEFSEKIREILLSKKYTINAVSELLLFEAARADLTEKVIIPALKNGTYVLSDRFYDSTTAYQGFGREIDLNFVNMINSFATHKIKPNLTFYMKISKDLADKRSKRRVQDRIESSGNEFFERVIKGYEKISVSEPERVIIIDASGTISHTHNLILKYIKF